VPKARDIDRNIDVVGECRRFRDHRVTKRDETCAAEQPTTLLTLMEDDE
jgi:hypothetical protein